MRRTLLGELERHGAEVTERRSRSSRSAPPRRGRRAAARAPSGGSSGSARGSRAAARPGTGISRAHSSGTALRPIRGRRRRGTRRRGPSVSVKMQLTRSSAASSLRASISRISSSVASRIASASFSVDRGGAAERDEPHRRAALQSARAAARPRRRVSRRCSPGSSSPSRSGPKRDALERAHAVADRLAHPPHLALAALVDRELEPVRRRAGAPARARCAPSSSSTPSRSARSAGSRTGGLRDRRAVGRGTSKRRVREPVGELAVVGQQDQAGGVGVEPADRVQAPLARDERRRPSGGPAGRCAVETTPARLVERRRPRAPARCRDRPAVDRDGVELVDVARRVGDDLAVDRHAAVERSSCSAARREATPAWARYLASRTSLPP